MLFFFFFKLFIPKQLQGVTLRLAVLAPRGLTKNVLTVLSLGTCLFKSLIPFRFFSAFKCLLHRRIQFSHSKFQLSMKTDRTTRGPKASTDNLSTHPHSSKQPNPDSSLKLTRRLHWSVTYEG